MFKERNSLDNVLHFLTKTQKLELKDLLIKFEKEGFENLGYLPDFSIPEICKEIDLDIQFSIQQEAAENAARNNQTTIPKENWGVHERHCCKEHGCKYGTIDCPVTLGLVKQEYPCEDCHPTIETYHPVFDDL